MHTLQGVALNPSPYLQGGRLDRLHELLAKTALNEFRESYNILGSKVET
jgi:hypothetical protein